PPLHRCERSSPVKNRMLEIGTSGSVRGRGGNIPTYSARGKPALRHDRGDDGNGGIIRSPQRAIVLPDNSHPVKVSQPAGSESCMWRWQNRSWGVDSRCQSRAVASILSTRWSLCFLGSRGSI